MTTTTDTELPLVHRDAVLLDLRRRIVQFGSQRLVARKAGVSPQYLTDVLHGRRRPTGKLLAWLGYEEREMYADLRGDRSRSPDPKLIIDDLMERYAPLLEALA